MTEILLTSKKPHKEENKFKRRLIHWPHFDPVRDLSHLLTVKIKRFCPIRLPNFFVNESLLYFEDGRNHVVFIIGKFDFEPRKSEKVLATARGFEAHKVPHINQTKYSATPPTKYIFFASQTLGGHVTSRNQGLSSND